MKIIKINIQNFRGIEKFDGDNSFGEYLTVLDGENGFGKTTIFDAIEFCITGWVQRLAYGKNDPNPSNPPSTVLKNKNHFKEISSVSILFDSGDKITREIPANIPGLMNDDERGLYKLIDGQSILKELNISSSNFRDIFYIPQTDSTQLISGTTKDIQSFLDKLFNTDEEVSFREDFLNNKNSIINSIISTKTRLELEQKKFQAELEENIKKLGEEKRLIETVSFIENNDLEDFTWYKNIEHKYSKSDFISENNTGYLVSWKKLSSIFIDKEITLSVLINNSIQEHKNEVNLHIIDLQKYINYSDSILKFGQDFVIDYNKKITLLEEYKSNIDLLNQGNSDLLLKKTELFRDISIFQNNLLYSDLVELEKKFGDVKGIISKKSVTEKIYNDIFTSLIGFWDNYSNITNNPIIISANQDLNSDDVCPLCTTKNVKDDILEQVIFLKKNAGIQNDDSAITWKLLYSLEFCKKIDDEKKQLKEKLTDIEKLQSFFDSSVYKNFENLYKKYGISIKQLYLNEIISKEQLDQNSEIIKVVLSNLEKEKITLNEVYSDESYETFLSHFIELFGVKYSKSSKEEFLDKLSKLEILNNIKFFENEQNKIINKDIDSLSKRNEELGSYISFFKNRLNFLSNTLNILNQYKDNLLANIKDYRKKKIGNIQLPVYIFSQRIVKNYHGIGILLKEDAIQLIEKDNKHSNPLFSLSSGQAEGVILAVMLANNLSQSFSKFGAILIDDPIQSLDDLNILSFINLLRYQFPEKQIIISTHDDDFSEFIRYKFWRLYGQESQVNINLKQKFLLS